MSHERTGDTRHAVDRAGSPVPSGRRAPGRDTALLHAGQPVDVIVSRPRGDHLDGPAAFRCAHWRADLASWLDPDRAGGLRHRRPATCRWAGHARPHAGHGGPADLDRGGPHRAGLSTGPAAAGRRVTLKDRRMLVVVQPETPDTRAYLNQPGRPTTPSAAVLPAERRLLRRRGSPSRRRRLRSRPAAPDVLRPSSTRWSAPVQRPGPRSHGPARPNPETRRRRPR